MKSVLDVYVKGIRIALILVGTAFLLLIASIFFLLLCLVAGAIVLWGVSLLVPTTDDFPFYILLILYLPIYAYLVGFGLVWLRFPEKILREFRSELKGMTG